MKSLRSLAKNEFEERITSKGLIRIENLVIRFPRIEKTDPLPEIVKGLAATHQAKRLVLVDGKEMFGELAILEYLRKDGWDGVWVDTYHKKFWATMSDRGTAILPLHAKQLCGKIVEKNCGKASGFFDVFAWKDAGSEYVFIEYKGKGDRPNANELRWIDAAIAAGIKPEQLFFVTY